MRVRPLLLIVTALAACSSEPVTSDTTAQPADRARAYIAAQVARSRTPGIQYLVLDSARVRFAYDGGWADLAQRAPMDSTTTMMAYSMSKTITAAAVLTLVQEGRVALDSPIAAYLDSLPYDRAITVRQLLAHTSGLPNPIPLRWVHPAARHPDYLEGPALEAIIRAHPRLSSPPGTRYAYSNIGYWLLGGIVERASGQPFSTYVRRRMFEPLGIAPAELGYTIPDGAPHATGYLAKYSLTNLLKGWLIDRELIGDYTGSWLAIRSHYVNGAAFGGLVGTARGFGMFLQDQLAPHSRVMNDATRALFFTQQHTTAGKPIAMTLGWHIGQANGSPFYYKEGGGGGFHNMMRLYPEEHIATIVMTNATGFDVRRFLDRVDPLFR
ncbi:MAG TPA: serine hydrolase domain-containing protein [Gemmatimonadales bacterium]|nr:serine hydrolase domain-containing protein [Gemmatimonadales bacterium]